VKKPIDAYFGSWWKICRSPLARNAGWVMAGQGAGLLFQAVYFLVLARLLGVTEYGIFAGAFALTSLLGQYSALGTGTVLLRYVSADARGFQSYWGNVLITTIGMGAMFTVVLHFIAIHLLNHQSAALVVPAAIANCICAPLVVETSRVFQAFEKMRAMAIVNLSTSFVRTSTVGLMFFVCHRATALQWSVASMLISLFGAILAAVWASVALGQPRSDTNLLLQRGWEGFGYSFASSTSAVYNDLDKTILGHYGMNKANGVYTMAYRILDITTVPIIALKDAALPRLFRLGRYGLGHTSDMSQRLLKKALPLSLAISFLLFLASPSIPRIVGNGFSDVVLALRLLFLIPVFRCVHQIMGSALTSSGLQRYRTLTQFMAALMNLGLNLWLIPVHGWRGAAWSSVATDGALVIMNCAIVLILRSRVRELTVARP